MANPGRVVTFHQLSALFSAAYMRAATMTTAINGLKELEYGLQMQICHLQQLKLQTERKHLNKILSKQKIRRLMQCHQHQRPLF